MADRYRTAPSGLSLDLSVNGDMVSVNGEHSVAGDVPETNAAMMQAAAMRLSTALPGPEWGDTLNPRDPLCQTPKELEKTYIKRAKARSERHHAEAGGSLPPMSDCHELGARYGLGVALYFRVLCWLQCIFLLMLVFAVPYLIVINQSAFTDAVHSHDHEFGVQRYPTFNVYSTTFAAIVDDSTDNGTLQYMNTAMANTWQGPMKKGTFLVWISLVDTAATLLFFLLIALCCRAINQLAKHVDSHAQEVKDYTIVVCGLPADADAKEIGEYFAKSGTVMDVVVIKDMGKVLQQCQEVSNLEQHIHHLRHSTSLRHRTERDLIRCQRMREKKEERVAKIHSEVDGKEMGLKAAFVTFNEAQERDNCLAMLPNSWLSSRFMKAETMLRGRCRFWVTAAAVPEEYLFENLSYGFGQRVARMVGLPLLILAIIAVCAIGLTKLSSLSVHESTTIDWKAADINADIYDSMRAWGINPSSNFSTSLTKPVGGGFAAVTGPGGSTVGSNGSQYSAQTLAGYCSVALPDVCQPWIGSAFNVSIEARFGSFYTWQNPMEQLINERPLTHQLRQCTDDGPNICHYSQCLPCYCLGLEVTANNNQAGWVRHAKDSCSTYISAFDIRSWSVRIGVALAIALINWLLKQLILVLVRFLKRWTYSGQEFCYACLCYVSQLVNSVAVLLMVNAAPIRNATHAVSSDGRAAWLRYLWLDGRYSDFSPGWYEDVGLSFLILLLINCFMPMIAVGTKLGLRGLNRLRVLWCMRHATQAHYNEAWAAPSFTLEQRVSDVMLNISLALLFGSGMPACYLIVVVALGVQNLVDRYYLTKLCGASARYSRQLPDLLLGLLPWAVIVHCGFGIWMHTYFVAITSDIKIDRAVASTNKKLNAASKAFRALTQSTWWRRMTQPNGLAMLLLVVVLLLWMLLFRFIWRKLLLKMSTAFRWQMTKAMFAEDAEGIRKTYQEGLEGNYGCHLKGAPTYRLPHHPRYVNHFNGTLYQHVWSAAVGSVRYTRLVFESKWLPLASRSSRRSRKNSKFVVTAAPIFTAQEADISRGNAHLPDPYQPADGNGGGVNHRAATPPRAHSLGQRPSLAGSELSVTSIGATSRAGSFGMLRLISAPSSPLPQRSDSAAGGTGSVPSGGGSAARRAVTAAGDSSLTAAAAAAAAVTAAGGAGGLPPRSRGQATPPRALSVSRIDLIIPNGNDSEGHDGTSNVRADSADVGRQLDQRLADLAKQEELRRRAGGAVITGGDDLTSVRDGAGLQAMGSAGDSAYGGYVHAGADIVVYGSGALNGVAGSSAGGASGSSIGGADNGGDYGAGPSRGPSRINSVASGEPYGSSTVFATAFITAPSAMLPDAAGLGGAGNTPPGLHGQLSASDLPAPRFSVEGSQAQEEFGVLQPPTLSAPPHQRISPRRLRMLDVAASAAAHGVGGESDGERVTPSLANSRPFSRSVAAHGGPMHSLHDSPIAPPATLRTFGGSPTNPGNATGSPAQPSPGRRTMGRRTEEVLEAPSLEEMASAMELTLNPTHMRLSNGGSAVNSSGGGGGYARGAAGIGGRWGAPVGNANNNARVVAASVDSNPGMLTLSRGVGGGAEGLTALQSSGSFGSITSASNLVRSHDSDSRIRQHISNSFAPPRRAPVPLASAFHQAAAGSAEGMAGTTLSYPAAAATAAGQRLDERV